MSFCVNCVVIGGNLSADPKIKTTSSGKSVASFSVALNGGTKEKPETAFVDVTAWGKTAELCEQYLKKGSQVLIEGSIRQDTWEDRNGGGKRSKLSVTAGRVQFIGGRQQDNTRSYNNNAYSEHQQAKANGYQPQSPYGAEDYPPPREAQQQGFNPDDDSEIPF